MLYKTCATLAWCARPWALHVKAKIAGLAGRTLSLVVVRGAVLPKFVLITDTVFDEVIRSCVVRFPFSLDRPSAVVCKLKARVALRWAKIYGPLSLWNRLVHHIIKFALESLLFPLIADGGDSNKDCIRGLDVRRNSIFKTVEPRVLIEPSFAGCDGWLCFSLLADHCLNFKRMLQNRLVNLVTDNLRVGCRMKAIANRYAVPNHFPAQINQRLANRQVSECYRANDEILADIWTVPKREAPSLIRENILVCQPVPRS